MSCWEKDDNECGPSVWLVAQSKTLKRAGLHVLRCDRHSFMTGALQVFDHPNFAVTDEFGLFELSPLPVGSYTIVVWHKALGSLDQEIRVPSQGANTINFYHPS